MGTLVGILSGISGADGGFIMVPATTYRLGMPTKVVVGTCLLQIIFVRAFFTLLHATTNYTVDINFRGIIARWHSSWSPIWNAAERENESRTASRFTNSDSFGSICKS